MNIQEIIGYHQNKLDFNTEKNIVLRSIDNSMKTGSYKPTYDKLVRKYRERIKFHQSAIDTLKEC